MREHLTDEQCKKLRDYIDRILALKALEDDKNLEIRGIYAEAKAAGYDKTSIGKVVGWMRLSDAQKKSLRGEQRAEFDMSLTGWSARPRAGGWGGH